MSQSEDLLKAIEERWPGIKNLGQGGNQYVAGAAAEREAKEPAFGDTQPMMGVNSGNLPTNLFSQSQEAVGGIGAGGIAGMGTGAPTGVRGMGTSAVTNTNNFVTTFGAGGEGGGAGAPGTTGTPTAPADINAMIQSAGTTGAHPPPPNTALAAPPAAAPTAAPPPDTGVGTFEGLADAAAYRQPSALPVSPPQTPPADLSGTLGDPSMQAAAQVRPPPTSIENQREADYQALVTGELPPGAPLAGGAAGPDTDRGAMYDENRVGVRAQNQMAGQQAQQFVPITQEMMPEQPMPQHPRGRPGGTRTTVPTDDGSLFGTVDRGHAGAPLNPETWHGQTPSVGIENPKAASQEEWEDAIVLSLQQEPVSTTSGFDSVNFIRFKDLDKVLDDMWGISGRTARSKDANGIWAGGELPEGSNVPTDISEGRDGMKRNILNKIYLYGPDTDTRADKQVKISPERAAHSGMSRRTHRTGDMYGLDTGEAIDTPISNTAYKNLTKYGVTQAVAEQHKEAADALESAGFGRPVFVAGQGNDLYTRLHREINQGVTTAEATAASSRLGGVRAAGAADRLVGGRAIGSDEVEAIISNNLGDPSKPNRGVDKKEFVSVLEQVRQGSSTSTKSKINEALASWEGKAVVDKQAAEGKKKEAPANSGTSKGTDKQEGAGVGGTGGPVTPAQRTLPELGTDIERGAATFVGALGSDSAGVRPRPGRAVTDPKQIAKLNQQAAERRGQAAGTAGANPAQPSQDLTTGNSDEDTVSSGTVITGGDPEAKTDAERIASGGVERVKLPGGAPGAGVRPDKDAVPDVPGNSPQVTEEVIGKGKKGAKTASTFGQILEGLGRLKSELTGEITGAAAEVLDSAADLTTPAGQNIAALSERINSLGEFFSKAGTVVSSELRSTAEYQKQKKEAEARGKKVGAYAGAGAYESAIEKRKLKERTNIAREILRDEYKDAPTKLDEINAEWEKATAQEADQEQEERLLAEIETVKEAYKKSDKHLLAMSQIAEAFGNAGRTAGQRTASHFLLGMNNPIKPYKARGIAEIRKMNKEEYDRELYRLSVYQITGHEFPEGTPVDQMKSLLGTLWQEKQAKQQRATVLRQLKQNSLVFKQQQQKALYLSLQQQGLDNQAATKLINDMAQLKLENDLKQQAARLEGKKHDLNVWNIYTTQALKAKELKQSEIEAIQKAAIAAKGTQVSEAHVKDIMEMSTLVGQVDKVIRAREQDPGATNTGWFDDFWEAKIKFLAGFGNEKYRTFRADTMSILNTYVNAITGKQMSSVEVARIKSVVPKVTDPEHLYLPMARTFRAYMMLGMKNYVRGLAAAGYDVEGLAGEIPAQWKIKVGNKWEKRTGTMKGYAWAVTHDPVTGNELSYEQIQNRKKYIRMLDDGGKDFVPGQSTGMITLERAQIEAMTPKDREKWVADLEDRAGIKRGENNTNKNIQLPQMPANPNIPQGQMNVRGVNTGQAPAGSPGVR